MKACCRDGGPWRTMRCYAAPLLVMLISASSWSTAELSSSSPASAAQEAPAGKHEGAAREIADALVGRGGAEAAIANQATSRRSSSACNLLAGVNESAVRDKEYILQGIRVGSTPDFIVVSMASSLSVLRKTYQDANPSPWYTPTIGKLGMQLRRYSFSGMTSWTSGTGDVGFVDGPSHVAQFSNKVSAISLYPTCLAIEATAAWDGRDTCPVNSRQGFVSSTRNVYVADSGNCAIRLVDSDTGDVATKWGMAGCLSGTPAYTAYVDSDYADVVRLGNDLSLAWVGWKFLIIVDEDARRLRKFVTGQHQGLSVLAGGAADACGTAQVDGAGDVATFCRPVAIAVSLDLSFAVVSEISTADGASVDRLRLVGFDYTYSPGGDVSNVTCTVSTLTEDVYANLYPQYLFRQRGGMLAAPDSTPTSGTLFVGSYPGNEWFNTVPPQFAASDDYTIAAVGIGNNEAKELVDANLDKLLGRTVLEVSESPTYPGYWQVSVAKHTLVDFTEPDYAAVISFKVPTSSIEQILVLASEASGTCPAP